MITCCKDCADRCAGCHADCEKYAAWKVEQEAARLARNKTKQAEYDAIHYTVDLKTRIQKGRFRK